MGLTVTERQQGAFEHEAFLYAEDADYVAGVVPFLRDAVAAGEPALVVVNTDKIELLRSGLDGDADAVHFADMADVGANPARIIPAWRRFVDAHAGAGRRLRGVGEPIWAGRSSAELTECQRHESLLNLAFAGGPPWRLMCPYDIQALPADVIDEARRTHPVIMEGGARRPSDHYPGLDEVTASTFDGELPEPESEPVELPIRRGPLGTLRRFVREQAAAAGLTASRKTDLVLAVNEVATNTLRHGGGRGLLRMWREGDTLISEVRDRGRLREPLVGRQLPPRDMRTGRGLWLANHVCDLVQLRSSPTGTVVRLHMRT